MNRYRDTGSFTGSEMTLHIIHTLCISFESKFDCDFENEVMRGHMDISNRHDRKTENHGLFSHAESHDKQNFSKFQNFTFFRNNV